MNRDTFNDSKFYDARIEEIVNENTVKVTIRLEDDDKVLKEFKLDSIKDFNSADKELKCLFMLDILNSVLPVGSFVKIKIHDSSITIFNRSLSKNLNTIINIVQNSNATYSI